MAKQTHAPTIALATTEHPPDASPQFEYPVSRSRGEIPPDLDFDGLAALVPDLASREELAEVLGRMASIYNELRLAFDARGAELELEREESARAFAGSSDPLSIRIGQVNPGLAPLTIATYVWTCSEGHASALREGVTPPLSCPFKHNSGGGPRCGRPRVGA